MRLVTICLVLVSFIYSNNSWDEILKYSAYFGGIHVASATLKSKDSTNSKGERIFKIEFKASPKPLLITFSLSTILLKLIHTVIAGNLSELKKI